jgi:UDP-N-acetylmuramoyl-L-alanyl-D-glutamate--2,6-diaminopimelate ligase
MLLSKILNHLINVPSSHDVDIQGLSSDSRTIAPGGLFFALKGTSADGQFYIEAAINQGAVAVLSHTEDVYPSFLWIDHVPVIAVPALSSRLGQIAANFYDHPASLLKIVGITGTNGKTSCSHFLAHAFKALNQKCAMIGTLGSGLPGLLTAGTLTTPDALTLQKLFYEFAQDKIPIVAMEVSSHSIDQGRINSVPFDVAIFTNLTRDHLDYHGDMQTYGAVKKKLFDDPSLKHAVINADDDFGLSLIDALPTKAIAYSLQSRPLLNVPLVFVTELSLSDQGMLASISSPWGNGVLRSSLIGQFNLSNLLAVLSALCLLDIPFQDALGALESLQPVAGRMQTLGGGDLPTIVVDYAHTPDALEKVLVAIRSQCSGKLWCLFGCGGDRDKGKRPMMAKIAEQYASDIVVTDDNPRTENARAIIEDILVGFSDDSRVTVEQDRSKAIEYIIHCANKHDYVLIAGKGAELFQQIGQEKIPFSDIEVAKRSLRRI